MRSINLPISLYSVLLTGFIFQMSSLLISCSNKSDDITEVISPVGSYTRTFTGTETYRAQISLKADGNWEWIMLDTLSTHTNSYSKVEILGSRLRIFNDPDFANDGIYDWSLSNGILTLSVVSDDYQARANGIAGSWEIRDTTNLYQITGSWQKTMELLGVNYRVKLTLTNTDTLKWQMVDSIPGHTDSYVSFTTIDNTIIIYNDPDCEGNGYYSYIVSDIALSIIILKDFCPPRSPSFSGTWNRLP